MNLLKKLLGQKKETPKKEGSCCQVKIVEVTEKKQK